MPRKQQGLEAWEDKTTQLPGWPGYRTRPGRSGYDPIDYQLEQAHMTGVFLRHAFTGRLRTRNPVYLAVMFLVGLVSVPALVLFIAGEFESGRLSAYLWCYAPLYGLIGSALGVNFIINIVNIIRSPGQPQEDEEELDEVEVADEVEEEVEPKGKESDLP